MAAKKFFLLLTTVAVAVAQSVLKGIRENSLASISGPAPRAPIIRPVSPLNEKYYNSYRPFAFAFQSNDGQGTTQVRRESADNDGSVKGTYGYVDPKGLFRAVDYVADVNGFRAVVKSNEPGTANQNPADVVYVIQPTPNSVNELSKKFVSPIPIRFAPTPSAPLPPQKTSPLPVKLYSALPPPRPTLVQLSTPVFSRPISAYKPSVSLDRPSSQTVAQVPKRQLKFTPRSGSI